MATKWSATPFSRFIKAQREAIGKSQVGFARGLTLTQSYISHLEAGRPPSTALEFLVPYAAALQVPTRVLVAKLRESGMSVSNPYDVDLDQLDADVAALAVDSGHLTASQLRQVHALVLKMGEENAQARAASLAPVTVEEVTPDPPGALPEPQDDAG